jgi:hypothetical protein
VFDGRAISGTGTPPTPSDDGPGGAAPSACHSDRLRSPRTWSAAALPPGSSPSSPPNGRTRNPCRPGSAATPCCGSASK